MDVGAAAGAFVVTGCEGGATAVVVGTLRTDGVGGGLAALVVAGAAGGAAVVEGTVVGRALLAGADALVLCEAPTCA
ncbi:hypothetical protein ABH926_007516 [Catenulispora sp. GP43]|uniref:hypothetical protein n=1 Tax=Catenulispora sp. GP43 TaxID=3156263 RepID=UPI0035178921